MLHRCTGKLYWCVCVERWTVISYIQQSSWLMEECGWQWRWCLCQSDFLQHAARGLCFLWRERTTAPVKRSAGRAHKHNMFHLLLSAVEALQKYSKEMIACKIDSDWFPCYIRYYKSNQSHINLHEDFRSEFKLGEAVFRHHWAKT